MTASGLIDLLIPRGGAGLIRACVESATVPCIETGTGICHVYVDKDADLEKALNIIENAKTSRPSVCNAEEVALVHAGRGRGSFCRVLKARLVDDAGGGRPDAGRAAAGRRGAEPSSPARPRANGILTRNSSITSLQSRSSPTRTRPSGTSPRTPRITPTPSSPKTRRRLQRFTRLVDSAAVYVNVSTRFTDGGEFGLGCEMGISTQKLHARGPMGLRELTTYKYIVTGDGQTR